MVWPLSRPAASNAPLERCIEWVQIPHSFSAKKNATPLGVAFFLAEMEGFEPPHVLRRLADFESAPFSRLGTSPYGY